MARFAMILMLAWWIVGCDAARRVESTHAGQPNAQNSVVRSASTEMLRLPDGAVRESQGEKRAEPNAVLRRQPEQSGMNLERQLDLLENEIGKRP